MSDLAADAGRNLLFGLLAFQNGFIERRSLLAAFDAWTNHQPKSRTLGQILVEDGAISQEIQRLIDGVVAAHLALHANQSEKSLAALSPIGPVHKDLEALADPEGLASLAQVSITPNISDSDPNSTLVYTAGLPSSAGLRFKILRPLNKGGMGVVSVALDTELDRSIALKEIRDTAADNGMYRARFLAEAEITGKLEHPGIIPIYGLGTYADGRPFYAMRLIRGNKTGSLMDAIKSFYQEPHPASRVVEFRGLLRRFLDVCNALSYAHSKGVLHRDLKPANILLGPYGETLVVDWGLAKAAGRADPIASTADDNERVELTLSGSELSPTVAGQILGTPEYAPPEQVVGDLANVGPRSDVYGLGAVLYSLMTGETPFSRKGVDLGELIRKIESGDFPSPRQVRADLDRPLEAICLKAMARKPADRYASVQSLADDVERYLADEPVAVYCEPWTVRARRWARKRRTLVSSAATALIVALVGLGVITAIQTKARNDLSKKNTALNQANAEVTKANRELTVANTALDEQRQRAEDREALAIRAVERFRDAIVNEPELKKTPALEALRKRLLNEPLAFFRNLRERLQADRDTRPESLERLAKASFDLSHLIHEIGNVQDALVALREAVAIQQKLADANPTNAKLQSDVALSYNNLAVELNNSGKPAESLKVHESAMAIRRKLVDTNPTVARFQYDLAQTYFNIGLIMIVTGKPAEALSAFETALTITQKLVDTVPTVSDSQSDLAAIYFQSYLAEIHFQIGLVLDSTGKVGEALKASETALTIRQKLVDTHPTATEFQSALAQSRNNIGNHLNAIGKPAEALEAYETAREIRQKLVENNPTDTVLQSALADSQYNIGSLLDTSGKPAEALNAFKSALAMNQKLSEANPSVPEMQRRVADCHHNMAFLLSRDGKQAEALKAYEAAVEIFQKLVDNNPTSIDFQSKLATSHDNVGGVYYISGKPDEAFKAFERGLAIRQKLAEDNPTNTTFQSEVARSYNNLGVELYNSGKPAEALKVHESAMTIRRKLVDTNPTEARFQYDLARTYYNIGLVMIVTGKPAEALSACETALTITQKLVDTDPTVTEFQSFLAGVHFQVGGLLDSTGKAEALKAYETALTIRQKLVDTYPAVTEFQSALAQSRNIIGIHLRAIGKLAEALEAFETAREIRQKLVENNPTDTALQSELAASHFNIGSLLDISGKPAEALNAFQSALAMFQKMAEANPGIPETHRRVADCHHNIAFLLSRNGKPAEALREYEVALEILRKLVDNNPSSIEYQSKLATAYDNIGAMYYGSGKQDEALETLERGLAIRQKIAEANPTVTEYQTLLGLSEHNIAVVDFNAKRFERALEGLRVAVKRKRKTLESNPANLFDRQQLSNSLTYLIATSRALGDFAGAVEAERELAEVRDSDPAIKELDSRLAAIITGEQKPTNQAERLQLAQRAYEKALHKTAAKLWGDALAANLKLGDDRQIQHRYNAACSAALAGCDKSKDDPPPSVDEKTQLRQQALDWLKAELDAWSQFLEAANKDQRGAIAGTLQHWKEDADLAGIRDDAELTKRPESEREAYLKLWADVDALLKKASGA